MGHRYRDMGHSVKFQSESKLLLLETLHPRSPPSLRITLFRSGLSLDREDEGDTVKQNNGRTPFFFHTCDTYTALFYGSRFVLV